MSQLAQLEAAAEALSAEDKRALVAFLQRKLQQESSPPAQRGGHSSLDIEPIHVGKILRPLSPDDDILGEMLEGRS